MDNAGCSDLVKPADEIADPGPDGRLDYTPAISRDGALIMTDDGQGDSQRMARFVASTTSSSARLYQDHDDHSITDDEQQGTRRMARLKAFRTSSSLTTPGIGNGCEEESQLRSPRRRMMPAVLDERDESQG